MTEYLVPEGRYWLGDPCYFAGEPDKRWRDWCDQWFANRNGAPIPDAVEGILALSTAYGDGSYMGSDGVDYSVDAGIIGLTHIDLWEQGNSASPADDAGLGRMVTVPSGGWICYDDGGVLHFGPVVIDTVNEEDDDYDWDHDPFDDPDYYEGN